MITNDEKSKALLEIQRLAQEHHISSQDLQKFLYMDGKKTDQTNKLKTVLGYVGGILIFAGIVTYVSIIWKDLDSLSRVLLTFGPGISTFILAIIAHHKNKYKKTVTPLFLISAFLQPTGLFVFLNEYFAAGDWHIGSMAVFFIMFFQYSIAFLKYKSELLAFLTLLFGFLFYGVLLDYLNIENDWGATIIGLSGLFIAYSMSCNNSYNYRFVPLLYFLFAIIFAVGTYLLLTDTAYDVFLLGIGALLLVSSIQANSRTLLTASILVLLCYISYFTNKYFLDVIGWPILLIVMGFITIGLSGFAFKLGKTMKSA